MACWCRPAQHSAVQWLRLRLLVVLLLLLSVPPARIALWGIANALFWNVPGRMR